MADQHHQLGIQVEPSNRDEIDAVIVSRLPSFLLARHRGGLHTAWFHSPKCPSSIVARPYVLPSILVPSSGLGFVIINIVPHGLENQARYNAIVLVRFGMLMTFGSHSSCYSWSGG
jgi:hypothetical protein